MNEKLKQLYQQAHEPQLPTRGTTEQIKDILWGQPDKFNPEKFAELIVEECAKVINADIEYQIKDGIISNVHGLNQARNLIKEHFGVEK